MRLLRPPATLRRARIPVDPCPRRCACRPDATPGIPEPLESRFRRLSASGARPAAVPAVTAPAPSPRPCQRTPVVPSRTSTGRPSPPEPACSRLVSASGSVHPAGEAGPSAHRRTASIPAPQRSRTAPPPIGPSRHGRSGPQPRGSTRQRRRRTGRSRAAPTSVSSLIQCRIEPFQLDAGVGSSEPPVDLCPEPVP